MTSVEVVLLCEPIEGGLTRASVRRGPSLVHVDEIRLDRQEDRTRFLERVVSAAPAMEDQMSDLDQKLLESAAKLAAGGTTPSAAAWPPAPSANPFVVPNTEPLRLAAHFLWHRARDKDGRLLLRRYAGSFWRWEGACFRELTDEEAKIPVYQHLDQVETPVFDPQGEPAGMARVVPTIKRVAEVAAALPSCDTLVRGTPPFWISPAPGSPEPRELMICSNGIVNLRTRELSAPTPDLFATVALPVAFDPDAPRPTNWLSFLDEVWGDDPESIASLQEWFGYLITTDTRLQKILLVVGPRRSGKGTMGRILTGLVGAANVTSPTLSGLAGDFGLQDMLGKSVALISDARLTGRIDQIAVVERLLAISGEDQITVNRKYKPPISTKLGARFIVMTNELPRFSDVSGALAGRFIVLQTHQSFYGKEDIGLTDRLLTELPGILLWSLDGYDRLMERGGFVQPKSSGELIEDLQTLGNPLSAFLRDCCVVGAGQHVPCATMYAHWCAWCVSNGIESAGTAQTFGRDLMAAVPGVRRRQVGPQGSRVGVYDGIGLRGTP